MTAPTNNSIVETILIGTGGGYGESIVVHLGNNDWMVVDSCIDPFTKKSLPLQYLEENNIDIETQVKLIVCTHWHDDHIRGISQILAIAKNAKFSMALANDKSKFIRFVELDVRKIDNGSIASSTCELSACLDILGKSKQVLKFAEADKVLLKKKENSINYEVIALSPSDTVIQEFMYEISTLVTEYGKTNRKIVYQKPNDKCVVLFIKINKQRILLGSDLEVSSDRRKGWLNIISENQTVDKKSNVFKIPHHGSETGYNEMIWEKLIKNNAISKLTPWNKGSKLPKIEILKKIKKHTSNIYITSDITLNQKPKKRDKSISKAIRDFKPTLREVKYVHGIIKCTCNIQTDSEWEISLFGSAKKCFLE